MAWLAQAEARQQRDLTRDAVRARAETLYGFVQEAWHVLEPTTTFVGGWAVQTICDHLEAVSDGVIARLLINIPPGFAKSLIVAVFWPAWEWTRRPSLRYLSASYELGLAIRDNTRMRRLIKSSWYQEHWPITIADDQDAKQKFENTSTGGRECRAFIGLTGGRGDRLIIDDPHSVVMAESDQQRGETVKIFLESVPHRINNPEADPIVVIMQRLHEQDVSGVILSRKMGYEHLCLPMEFEPDRICRTSIGFTDPRTYEGELLAPERMGREAVDRLKASLGPYGIAGQLQQRPTAREGNLFKVNRLEVIPVVPAGMLKVVRAWDFASTRYEPGKNPDWTAGVKVGQMGDGRLIVLGVERDRLSGAEVETLVGRTASRDGSECRVRIPQDPGQAGKAQAEAYSRKLRGYPITILPVTGDKVTRANPAASQVEYGNVLLLKAEWNDAFIAELASFPNGAHDDQVDAFSDAMAEISKTMAGEGVYLFTQQEAAKADRERLGEKPPVQEDGLVGIIPPGAISQATARDGTIYVRGADGVMRVHPDDAPDLLKNWGWVRAPAPAGAAA